MLEWERMADGAYRLEVPGGYLYKVRIGVTRLNYGSEPCWKVIFVPV